MAKLISKFYREQESGEVVVNFTKEFDGLSNVFKLDSLVEMKMVVDGLVDRMRIIVEKDSVGNS